MTEYEAQQTEVPEEDGLIFAIRLGGDGTGQLVDWQTVAAWGPDEPPLWIHLDRSSARAQAWLREQSALTAATAEALLAEETRPRVFHGKRGIVTVLRGVNMNPGQKTEDMIAIRIWSEGLRVISLRDARLQSARDVLSALIDHGTGPKTISDVYVRLIARINERIAPAIEAHEEQIDQIESSLSLADPKSARKSIADLRQKVVVARRYLAPQRAALAELAADPPGWASEAWRPSLRDTADREQCPNGWCNFRR